jgi:mannose-6-phosphate isomerase-like protein (cupin superfamily)
MLIARNDETSPAKGWYLQLSHPALPAIGFANQGVNEPHCHRELREVYLVARGSSTMVIDGTDVPLRAGDVIVVEPGEVHTFAASSADYFHFVLHCPPIRGDKVPADRVS